ncbi:hypothetical protein GOODEAATRI_000331, partial [Goodea atripinnis]
GFGRDVSPLRNQSSLGSCLIACFFCLLPAEQMFWEVMRLRREMTVAKLGFYLTDQG